MGIYDRDYIRNAPPPGGFAQFRALSINSWLIGLNVGVFVLNAILREGLFKIGYFSFVAAFVHFQLWRIVTFQFLHANLYHLLGNMLGLYFFGTLIEMQLGRWRYLIFYLLCGMAGAAMYCVLMVLGALHDGWATPLIGASAGVFGVLIAAALIAPDATVMLLFPPIPMRLRTLAWILVGLATFMVFTNGRNAGGEAAHLGGAIVGYLLIKNQFWINRLLPAGRRRVRYKDWSQDLNR